MSALRIKYFYDLLNRNDDHLFFNNLGDYVKDSNEIASGYFRFNNPWDMESCNTPFRLLKGKTYYSPNGDPEWVYSYSRMEYLRKLIIAFYTTKDLKYLELHEEITHTFFLQNNQWISRLQKPSSNIVVRGCRKAHRIIRESLLSLPSKHSTYRTLDTAIRNYSLLVDCCYMKVSNRCDKYCSFLYKRVMEDLDFVIRDFSEFDEFSNWGLIKMLLYATCKIISGSNDIHSEEVTIIRLLNNQIKKDGGHIENSNMYHIQILICLLRFIYWCRLENILFSDEIYTTAKRMTEFAYNLVDPLGFQIMYGDSDYTCLDTVFYIASNVLGFGKRLYKNKPEDTLLLMEFPTLVNCEDIQVPYIKQSSKELDGGIWCYNSSDYFIRAFNEASKSGHKHADNGEVIIYYNGTPIVTDLGRYSYFEEKRRQYYRGPMAHNIMLIDNGVEWEAKNNWSFKDNPSYICNEVLNEGYKMQYTFISTGYEYTRYVIFFSDMVIIASCAKVNDDGKHEIKSIWNFVNGGFICEKGEFVCNSGIAMYYVGEISISEGKISQRYNDEEPSGVQAIVSKTFERAGFQIVCFSEKHIFITERNEQECTILMDEGSVEFHFDPQTMSLKWNI